MDEEKKEKQDKKHPLEILCKDFVHSIEGLSESLPFIMSVLLAMEGSFDKNLSKFIDEHAIIIEENDDGKSYSIELKDKPEHDKYHNNLRIFKEAVDVTPKSFLVSIVSAYDAFLGRIIKQLFYIKPELLNSSERVLTFSQLTELKTLEAAREFLVEKEVESVLRKSHSQQFDWLEKTFSIPLRKGLDCWPIFIEITERRNLFVHAGGVVNEQYLTVCRDHKCKLNDKSVNGKSLHVDPSYYNETASCIFEIGIKLAHVLWRKLDPDTRDAADENLIEIIYDLLKKEKYILAAELAHFGTNSILKHSNDQCRRIFIINMAIAYKFSKQNDKCKKILDNEDWSSTADCFKLGVAVLHEDWKTAASIMKSIGDSKSPTKYEYRDWPLFEEFRNRKEFIDTYKEIFKEDFILVEHEPSKIASKNEDIQIEPPELKSE